MGEVQAAAGFDRLPWLADGPAVAPRPVRRSWPLWLASALISLAAIAAALYWFTTRDAVPPTPRPAVVAVSDRPPVTIPLPAPIPPVPQPELAIDPQPEVVPAPIPPAPATREVVRAARPAARPAPHAAPHRASQSRPRAQTAPTSHVTVHRGIAKPRPAGRSASTALPIWPVRAEQNSAGRLVRVGTFSTPLQAKKGWARVMHFYPGMKRLPALVVPIRAMPSGRSYYRLQMGTTSQAHSEVLCQRMRIIGVSCLVLDIGTRRR